MPALQRKIDNEQLIIFEHSKRCDDLNCNNCRTFLTVQSFVGDIEIIFGGFISAPFGTPVKIRDINAFSESGFHNWQIVTPGNSLLGSYHEYEVFVVWPIVQLEDTRPIIVE